MDKKDKELNANIETAIATALICFSIEHQGLSDNLDEDDKEDIEGTINTAFYIARQMNLKRIQRINNNNNNNE